MIKINFCPDCFEKQKKIDRLTEENQRLRQKLFQKERKEKDGFFGLSTPSSQIPVKPNTPQEERRKRGGRKKGYQGTGRRGFTVDEADHLKDIPCILEICPDCQSPLIEKKNASRSVLDIQPVRTEKILMTLHVKECLRCHRLFTAKAPGVLPNHLLGNELLTYVAVSHYLHGIPMGRIIKQLKIKRSALTHAMHRLAKIFEKVVSCLMEEYRQAKVKHADETSWRNDGHSGYAWVFCAAGIALFLCRDTRSSEIPREVFGKDPFGVLVVDRYRGYDFISCKQYCYEHLKRETEKTQKEFPDSEEVQKFTTHFRLLLVKAIQLRKQPISDSIYYEEARKLEKEIVKAAEAPSQHAGIRYLQDIFLEKRDSLYRWVKNRDVPADNNFAERMIRLLAIARKVSFGSQSEQGAKTRSTLMTVLHTMDLRGIDVSAAFKKALDAIAENPSADLDALLFGKNETTPPTSQKKTTNTNHRLINKVQSVFKQNVIPNSHSPPVFQ
jgi:transposase